LIDVTLKANISFGTFVSYAEVLIERGLLIETTNFDRDQRVRYFKTTEKERKEVPTSNPRGEETDWHA